MKVRIESNQLKKILKIGGAGLGILLFSFLSWQLIFSKFYIFSKQEKEFLNTVKDYYDNNPSYYPKTGETKEVTLQSLYSSERINALYIPKTKKLCSPDSWVRIYKNDKEEYEYFVYLECGRYKSKVDNKGPEIKLNGDTTIIADYGKEYKDQGVKSVTDNVDGKIDISKVVIDTSKVNVNKVGSYTVTYKVRDKLYNETTVKRTVIVARNLSELVKSSTADNNFYQGKTANNYLQYSGMLWQIIRVNDDGTVKIAAADNVATINYGNNKDNFNDSNIKRWLNDYFYSYLNKADKYVNKDSKWCIDDIIDNNSSSLNCTNYSKKSSVGLLTLGEYYATKNATGSYLDTINPYWFINKSYEVKAWAHYYFDQRGLREIDDVSLMGVRPVINLKANLYVSNGNGSYEKPYKIGDYNTGKENDLLNTRLVGEHVIYSGYEWRISDKDDDGNVKLAMIGALKNVKTNDTLYTDYSNANGILKFNVKEEGNLGYKLNNDYIDYIKDNLIIKHEFTVPTYEQGQYYNKLKTEKFSAKLSLVSSYEMFSGNTELQDYFQGNYWLIDYVPDGSSAYMINSQNGMVFSVSKDNYGTNGMRLVVYLDKKVKLTKGSGTHLDPYYVK